MMTVKARIRFHGGVVHETAGCAGLRFDSARPPVQIYYSHDMPVPFWSRAGQKKQATILLPDDLSGLTCAKLMIRIWDGGEGSVAEPFKINGYPHEITSGEAIHDVVFTEKEVPVSQLRTGKNRITLLSDTDHHGIEVLLPGPALVLQYGK